MNEPGRVTIDLDSVTLEALTWGPPTGPLALCLHGFPDSAHTWRHVGPSLGAAGWRVVAPFSRGYDPSSTARDGRYDIHALADDVIGVHAALGGDGTAVVIGHDWGAVTVNVLAARADSPFSRVVSMSVPPLPLLAAAGGRRGVRKVALLGRQVVRSSYMAFFQLPLIPERTFRSVMPRLWARWSPHYDASADIALVLESLGSRERVHAALGYYRAAARSPGGLGGMPRVPMLYLHGSDDGCVTAAFADAADRMLTAPSAVAVVPSAGHFLQLDQPDEVLRHILAFLAR